MKANERLKRQIVDEAFAIVRSPSDTLINHCFSIDRDLYMAIGIVSSVRLHVHVHLVPFAFFEAS
jgi:hypothetical protein